MPLRALPASCKVGGAHDLDGTREAHRRILVDGDLDMGRARFGHLIK